MDPLRVCINTQTPLLQFPSAEETPRPLWTIENDFSKLTAGLDYRFSPGGVTRMVYPLAKRLIANGVWKEVHWVSLNPNAPETVQLPGITLHNVTIGRDRMGGYGKVKETIWTTVHGLDGPPLSEELFWTDDYGEYTYYNRTTAELIRSLDADVDFDLFYIHDFQQLPIGHMLGTLKPKVFRWHIPFDASRIPEQWRQLFSTYLTAYDVVVVSSEKYRSAFRKFGHKGRVQRLYPFIDPQEYHHPTPEEVGAVVSQKGIGPVDTVVLVVARMDPAKGQDRAITALSRLKDRFPHLRLVLAGNGSFSSARAGLGLSKSGTWRRHLEEHARSLGVADRVILTGHVTQHELDCLYERCAFSILPSKFEGFGLVVIESWLHHRPTLVTERAGVAELIRDGENGLLFNPDDPNELERQMRRLLSPRGKLAERVAEGGFRTSRRCSIDAAAREESRLLGEMVEA
ncbi:MAG TPA: glycosyltransferase family 4 protein [Thermoplasmata archaeon]|nr:glycosyltransferase family 4 protein [Thermoplasmata archaeon]